MQLVEGINKCQHDGFLWIIARNVISRFYKVKMTQAKEILYTCYCSLFHIFQDKFKYPSFKNIELSLVWIHFCVTFMVSSLKIKSSYWLTWHANAFTQIIFIQQMPFKLLLLNIYIRLLLIFWRSIYIYIYIVAGKLLNL